MFQLPITLHICSPFLVLYNDLLHITLDHSLSKAMTPLYLVPETPFRRSPKFMNSVKLVIHIKKRSTRIPEQVVEEGPATAHVRPR